MLWLRPDWVTYMDVDMQKDGGARQFTAESVRRPPFLWSLESQHDLQGVANRALGTAEGSGHLEQCCRPGFLSSKPAAQRLPRDLSAFAVAKPNHIDQRAFRGVEAEGQILADPDHSPAEVEGISGEDMNVRG